MDIVLEAAVVLDRVVAGVVVEVARIAHPRSPTIRCCLRARVAAACCCFLVWEVMVVAGECQGFLVR